MGHMLKIGFVIGIELKCVCDITFGGAFKISSLSISPLFCYRDKFLFVPGSPSDRLKTLFAKKWTYLIFGKVEKLSLELVQAKIQ